MKKRCTAEQLRIEIEVRVRASGWADGYCRDCTIPQPYRIPHDGIANWTINFSSMNKPGCETLMLEIVDRLRREYELPQETLRETIRKLLSWRDA